MATSNRLADRQPAACLIAAGGHPARPRRPSSPAGGVTRPVPESNSQHSPLTDCVLGGSLSSPSEVDDDSRFPKEAAKALAASVRCPTPAMARLSSPSSTSRRLHARVRRDRGVLNALGLRIAFCSSVNHARMRAADQA